MLGKLPIYFVVVFMAFVCGTQAYAADDTVSVSSSADTRRIQVTIRNPGKRCGVSIEFGDGRGMNRIIDGKKAIKVNHFYIDVGDYVVTVKGNSVSDGTNVFRGGPRAREGCDLNAEIPVTVKLNDYVVLASRGLFRPITTLDGESRMTLSKNFESDATFRVCYVPSSRITDSVLEIFADSLREEMRSFYGGLATQNTFDSHIYHYDFRPELSKWEYEVESFWQSSEWARNMLSCPIVVVSPSFEKAVHAATEYADFNLMERVGQISSSNYWGRAMAQVEALMQDQKERERAYAERLTRFARLAKEDSRDTVGSVTLGWPREKGKVTFCTISQEGLAATAIAEYRRHGLATQSAEFQAKAEELSATIDADRLFSKTFDNVEELYQGWQSSRAECLVYVDTPANLNRIAVAIQRDFKQDITVNELISTSELQDSYAKREGYRSYADLRSAKAHMQAMKVEEKHYFRLRDYDIQDKRSMDEAFREMYASGYSDNDDVWTLLGYLADRVEAAKVAGATATSIRDQRDQQRRQTAIAVMQAEEGFEREFPYVAVLTCGMPGMEHLNIYPCFSSGPSLSVLSIRNGGEVTTYNAINLSEAGEIQLDGLHVNLRSSFAISAQNGDDTLVLGLKIIERSTGRVIHHSYATKYRHVKAQR